MLQIPALANKRYFNFGGQGTMPQSSLDAIVAAYKFVQEKGPFSTAIFHWITDELVATREAVAEELGGPPECWALTNNVTEGCNIVLWGMEWKEGDHLLLSDSEHVGVIGAAENIARRLGLKLSYFSVAQKNDQEILENLRNALTERTKLVLFSHILWNTGQRMPMNEMADVCANAGAQVLVDGAQSAGVMALDLGKTNVDYYCTCGHKWLCGPEGVGVLYVRKDRLATLKPTFTGWRMDMTGSADRIDGSRFEIATSAFPLLSGLRASIAFHRKHGSAADRERMILSKTALLREQLKSIPGIECVDKGQPASGLTSFIVDGAKHGRLVHELEAENLMLRTIPTPDCIRASVHYFTNDEDIGALAEMLRKQRV